MTTASFHQQNMCNGTITRFLNNYVARLTLSDNNALCASMGTPSISKAMAKYAEYVPSATRARSLDLETDILADSFSEMTDQEHSAIWPNMSMAQIISSDISDQTISCFPSELLYHLIQHAQAEGVLPAKDVVLHEILESGWFVPLHKDFHTVDDIRDHYIFSSVIANQNWNQKSVLSVVLPNFEINRIVIGVGDMYLLDPAQPHSLHPYDPSQLYGGLVDKSDPFGMQAYHQTFIPRSWLQNKTHALILETLISTAFRLSGCQISDSDK